MENIIYNHLIGNGYKVDVGCVTFYQKDGEGKTTRTTLEVDFVCNKGSERVYINLLTLYLTKKTETGTALTNPYRRLIYKNNYYNR